MNGWQTPHLSVLTGTDKDALQSIFRSLQEEIERLNRRIEFLESAAKGRKPNNYGEQKGY